MNLQPVKTAEGCRLRDPRTRAVLPNVSDAAAQPVSVDLDDPHWHRALQCGDIVVIKAAAPAAPMPAIGQPAAPAPAAGSSATVKN
jgi:hypothetical protein